MSPRNQSRVTEFILLGFGTYRSYGVSIVLFIIFLNIFVFTIAGNVLIILLVLCSNHLQSPMYFFLSHLSFADILLSTNTVPNMLGAILLGRKIMTSLGCLTQFYFFSGTTITECFLLSLMSYDRYLAICNPLRYTSIMDSNSQVYLSTIPWLLGFMLNLTSVIPISNFQFCDGNIIDHFYCDVSPLQKLSCSDTYLAEFIIFVLSIPIFICPCGFIIVTYVFIFITILRIPSTTGRQKTFSTCSSHLLVVGTFYGTLITKYMIPSTGHSLLVNKIISLLHTVFTPLLNPIIYSLRNQDIKVALKKIFVGLKCNA
ncbi:olfactory receptor 11L1-like [Spea bombifrons]|uniref:olfactory receptor 11L1-like n=1 Tax=Spea bombifrons TaxID=233779 RepID=UPI00234B5CA8|nr:olfactory receptor 11L1-like [Spea bombifrons]